MPIVKNLGNGSDNDFGTIWDDVIYGNSGNDTLSDVTGNDVIYGGNSSTAFDDAVFDGHDVLYGDQGKDTLYGGTGNDTLYGGADSDIIHGGYGDVAVDKLIAVVQDVSQMSVDHSYFKFI